MGAHAQAGNAVDASNGLEVKYINESDSSVDFQKFFLLFKCRH